MLLGLFHFFEINIFPGFLFWRGLRLARRLPFPGLGTISFFLHPLVHFPKTFFDPGARSVNRYHQFKYELVSQVDQERIKQVNHRAKIRFRVFSLPAGRLPLPKN